MKLLILFVFAGLLVVVVKGTAPLEADYKAMMVSGVQSQNVSMTAKTETASPPSYPKPCIGFEDKCDALVRAGFTGDNLAVMAAVARGESSFRQEAVGDVHLEDGKWGPSVSFLQIRTLKHPGGNLCRDRNYILASYDNTARCGWEISSGGTNFRPWTVFLIGKYKQYL